MKEKDFIPLWMKKYRSDVWSYKIHDSKFTGKKPFDVFGYIKNPYQHGPKCFAYEFKFHKSMLNWNLDKVTPFQIESLRQVKEYDVDACIILGVKAKLTTQQMTYEVYKQIGPNVNLSVVWPIESFLAYKLNNKHLNVRDLFKSFGNTNIEGPCLTKFLGI